MIMLWLGFAASLAGILIISKKNLALALISGALLLGLFTMPIAQLAGRIVQTLTDPSILMLAAAMGIIPLLGGTMKDSGQVDSLVNNLRLPRRYLLPFASSLMGLLVMPGGALLSAPILEKGGEGVTPSLNAAINNWFRHVLILVYPLAPALIVSAQICDLDVYRAILYLFPAAILATILGYVFFLRRVHGNPERKAGFSWVGLLVPLTVILIAPGLDFGLKRIFSIDTSATLIGVCAAVALSIGFSRAKLDLKKITRQMKPWNFGLIIIGMFLYLHIFQESNVGGLIAGIPLPPLVVAVVGGFFLAALTGRVQLPASIIFPVFVGIAGHIGPFVFALIFVGIYFGYIISPVHPCLVVTCEYFHVPLKAMIRELAWPTAIMFAAVLVIAAIIV